jgi:hypothetical protein
MWSKQLMAGRKAHRGNPSFFERAIRNCPLARTMDTQVKPVSTTNVRRHLGWYRPAHLAHCGLRP